MQCAWKYDWGSIPDWIVAAVAVAAALIAWRQLRAAIQTAREQIAALGEATNAQLDAAAKATRDQAQIARATLILEIDRDFEAVEMQESRLALRGLRNEIEAFVKNRSPGIHNEQLHNAVNEEFSTYLNMLWSDFRQADRKIKSPDLRRLLNEHLDRANAQPDIVQPHERAGVHYQRLTKIFGWLERVAHMANQKLLPQSDIIALYDFVFIELGGWFAGHIRYRQEDGPLQNPDFLAETVKFRTKILEKRKPPKLVEPNPVGVSGFGSA